MNRFVIETIEMDDKYARVKKFEYSKFNDKLPPIQEIKTQHSEPSSEYVQTNEVTEDEIPF